MKTQKSRELVNKINKLYEDFTSFLEKQSELTDLQQRRNLYTEKVEVYKKCMFDLFREYAGTDLSDEQKRGFDSGLLTSLQKKEHDFIEFLKSKNKRLAGRPDTPEYTYLRALSKTLFSLLKSPPTRSSLQEQEPVHETHVGQRAHLAEKEKTTPAVLQKYEPTDTLPATQQINEINSEKQEVSVLTPDQEKIRLQLQKKLHSLQLTEIKSWSQIGEFEQVEKVKQHYITCRAQLLEISTEREKILPTHSKTQTVRLENLVIPENLYQFKAREGKEQNIYNTLRRTRDELKNILDISQN